MRSNSWKSYENYIARLFGGKRTTSGMQSQQATSSDIIVEGGKLFIEVKDRETKRVMSWWRKTVSQSQKEKKIPVLVFKGENREGPLILFRLRDYKEVLERIGNREHNIRDMETK